MVSSPPSDRVCALAVVGASAGGVEALRRLVSLLPENLCAAVVVVLHVPSASESQLASILDRSGPLPVAQANDGATLELGHIVVAPPDHHVIINRTTLTVSRGPRINGHRPAIDPLFRSAGAWYGPHATGVLLTGTLDDGVAGLIRLQQCGGLTIAQDPDEAAYPNLPRAAMRAGAVQRVLGVREIAAVITANAPTQAVDLDALAVLQEREAEMTESTVSPFTCPNCHGTLWEIDATTGMQYRCRTGHTFSPEGLVEITNEALDDAMWGAYRSLIEHADLARRVARRMRDLGNTRSSERHDRLANDSERRARVIYDVLVSSEPGASVAHHA